MNNEMQIMKIMELREKGYGYKRIAKELDMTVSAVRYAITKYEEDEVLSGVCKNCGQETMSIKGRKKRYSVLTNVGGLGGTKTRGK